MQVEHDQVTQDFKSGVLKWKDISLPKIREIGNGIVDQILKGITDEFKAIKQSILGEISNDLSIVKAVETKVEDQLRGIFRSIPFGGGN